MRRPDLRSPFIVSPVGLLGSLLAAALIATSALGAESDAEPAVIAPINPSAASATATNLAKPGKIENDLSVGKSTNELLDFQAQSPYLKEQNRQAIASLERLRSTTFTNNVNQWIEAAKTLRALMDSDASKEIKRDAKAIELLTLAGVAQKAQLKEDELQYLAEYIERFSDDPLIPEILLRQAILLRDMGAYDMAISKLYSVTTAALRIKTSNLDYFKRVTLTAEVELAETEYMQSNFKRAAALYQVLVKRADQDLNMTALRTKLIRSLANLARTEEYKKDDGLRHAVDNEIVQNSELFLRTAPDAPTQAEIRYHRAAAFKDLGRKNEALQEIELLLEANDIASDDLKTKWRPWKILAGNEVANQLYLEGDWINALAVYVGLLKMETSTNDLLPTEYQIGLCYEKLLQPIQAKKTYNDIIAQSKKAEDPQEPRIKLIADMASWRIEAIDLTQSFEKTAVKTEARGVDKDTATAPTKQQ